MSVIIDAIEAAKRERARRESQGARSSEVPVLVPLRSRPRSSLDGRRIAMRSAFGLVAVVVVAAGALLISRIGTTSLPAVPPLTSTILSEALAADSANRAAQTAPKQRATASADSTRVASALPSPPHTTEPTAVAASTARDTFAVPQGQARTAAEVPPVSAPGRGVSSFGRLRISVEQPGKPETARLFNEAVAAHRAGDLATARKLYDNVLELNPRDGDALNNLGVLLLSQREYTRALDLLRRAASVTPRNAGVWNNIGSVYREQGRNSDAVAAFRHALTIDPAHPGAKVGLAQQYLAISALDQARALLEDVVAEHPQLPEAQYTLGQVLELQGDRAGAIRAYGAFVKAAPSRLSNHVTLVNRRIEALSR